MTSPERTSPERTAAERSHAPRAFVALAIALAGTVAFVVGLRNALGRLPPERAATAADSARYDSIRASRRDPLPAAQPGDQLPRLR